MKLLNADISSLTLIISSRGDYFDFFFGLFNITIFMQTEIDTKSSENISIKDCKSESTFI